MIYKTVKKGSPPSIVIFKNKKRKGRASITEDCQPIIIEGIKKSENHHFSNTSLITVSGKDHKCTVILVGNGCYWQIGYSPSPKDHKLVLTAQRKSIFVTGRCGEHLLNEGVKLPSPIKGPCDAMPLFWWCNQRHKPPLSSSLAKNV